MPPATFSSQKKATKKMNSRQRPLHACGASILAIGDIAIGKTQNIKGPLGATLRNMANLAKFVTPLIYAIQYQWLATLAFIDDRILAAEHITEKWFPPSTYAFNKIDEIVLMIVSLPDKVDGALDKYVPVIIHHVPLLEWTLKIVISKLNYLASTWVHENSSVDEKTIGVDRNYCNNNNNNNNNEVESSASEEFLNLQVDQSSVESFPPIPEAENKGVIMAVPCSHKKKGSYKEVLLEGSEKKIECEECDKMKGSYKEVLLEKSEKKIDQCEEYEGKQKKIDESAEELDESIMKYNVERNEKRNENMKHDPLLELFENAWLMSPASYRNNGEKEN